MRCISYIQNKGWKQNKQCFSALAFNVHTVTNKHTTATKWSDQINSILIPYDYFPVSSKHMAFRPRHVHLFIYLECGDFCSQSTPNFNTSTCHFRKALTCFFRGRWIDDAYCDLVNSSEADHQCMYAWQLLDMLHFLVRSPWKVNIILMSF